MADIVITYRCKCMVAEESCKGRPRRTSEDVVEWVQGPVTAGLVAAHRRRSPWCDSPATDYVKIPAPDSAPFLGGEPKLDS